jgi:hypothetical protein
MASKRALIIGTEVATNGFESGASLRLNGIKDLLEQYQLKVTVASRSEASYHLKNDWDLIVLVSFATAQFLGKARKNTKFLWFDSTDSCRLTRLSLMRSGDLRQLPIFMRELFWLWTAPPVDMLTFVTRRDADAEKTWWVKRLHPLIYPVQNLTRPVNSSKETRLVFVGDGSYGPNLRAIYFLKRVLDMLPTNRQIHVYGRGFENLDPRFVIRGYCPVEEMYFENDIHLAPLDSGAGLKLKVAVPLTNGLRVISTPEGANGFTQNSNLFLARDEKSFASQILRLSGVSNSNEGIAGSGIYEEDGTEHIQVWINKSIRSSS